MATSSTAMGKIMRASPWFAALCVSLGTGVSQAADGLDLALRSRAAIVRAESAEPAPFAFTITRVHEASVPHAYGHAEAPWLLPVCHAHEGCGDSADARLFYRGARRYMPAMDGLAAEGISLRRDRLVLRYSFR